MHNVTELLNKIKKEGIKPKPKWQFVMKNLLFWFLFGFSILLGSTALSIIIHSFDDSGMGLWSHFINRRFSIVIEFFPIYWTVFFAIFIASSLFGIAHTKKGYKYTKSIVVLGAIIGSMIFGYVVYLTGQAERLEHGFANRMPMYRSMEDRGNRMWNMVDKGFLKGEVIMVGNNVIKIFDGKGIIWDVKYQNVNLNTKVGDIIRFIGKKTDNNKFEAKRVILGKNMNTMKRL